MLDMVIVELRMIVVMVVTGGTTQWMDPESNGGGLLRPTWTLWRREVVRFLRQRNRVIGALLTPLVFWMLLGFGLDKSFRLIDEVGAAGESVGYLEYFFPGTIVMILLFTAIFSTISVIEDRREGFLQGVLAAPVPRLAIVLGKVLGGATLATGQGVVVMLLWPLIGGFPGIEAMVLSVVCMFVMAVGLTALGLCIAWPMDSVAGFHAIMNLFLMPMWFLCGALFPVSAAPSWMAAVMYANPLTYGQATLRWTMSGAASPITPAMGWAVMTLFAVAMVAASGWLVAQPRKNGS